MVIRLGELSDNASSQKLGELKTLVALRAPGIACLVSETGGWDEPSGNKPTSSGRFLTTRSATGTTSPIATTPSTAYAPRQSMLSIRNLANGGKRAVDITAPMVITLTARPRRETNHWFTSRMQLMFNEPWPRARKLAKAMKKRRMLVAVAMPKQAAPRPSPAATSIILGPYRSARRLTNVTRTALARVLAKYSTEIPVRDSPVSSIMESMKTEKT